MITEGRRAVQYTLKIFEYEEGRQFRTLEINGEVWFYAIDVVQALDIKNPSDAYSRLDNDDLGTTEGVDALGKKQSFRIVSEAGLYDLIFQSRKPEAQKFKKWVTHEVLPQIRKTGGYSLRPVPVFIRRYNANWERIDNGYFSVISELVIRLWGRLEHVGHIMADVAPNGKELRPDVSVGRRLSEWLASEHPEVSDNYTFYLHWTPQGEFPARQYPRQLLPLYLDFIDNIWIPEFSEEYFKKRDPAALPYLPKLLPSANKPKPGMIKGPTVKKTRK